MHDGQKRMSLTCFAPLSTNDLENSWNTGEAKRQNEIIEMT